MRIIPCATALFPFLGLAIGASGRPGCRCLAHESCWPSKTEWQALNKTINGNLVVVRPIGQACHDPTFDKEGCNFVTAMSENSTWRSDQPGALLSTNWESWPEENEACYVDSARKVPCGQGRIPRFSAIVHTPQHIQESVRFADKHNLRLVIRNTGHDFLGRSAAPESFQIFTHNMKDIKFTDDFKPEGKRGHQGVGQAVTIGAGVQLAELYLASSKLGKTQIVGLSIGVGAAGGFIQGGGHSPLGPWKGMPTDHVLEYEVVTAKGQLVIANDYVNRDLFWALRGGGGGTFGVVCSVTLRTFEDVPVVASRFNFTMGGRANESFWGAVEKFQAFLPHISAMGGVGYYYIVPNIDFFSQPAAGLVGALWYIDQDNEEKIERLYEPLFSEVRKLSGINVGHVTNVFPSSTAAFSEILTAPPNEGGGVTLLGSRLYSEKLLKSSDGPAKLTNTISKLRFENGDTVVGHLVAGGQVARNKHVDSALNPSWREALVHVVLTRRWTSDTPFEEQERIHTNLTKVEVPLLAAVEPEMGAYVNEADVAEPAFQRTFWGSNYPRLALIKQRWDPKGLFFVRSGVGSEFWDKQGLCRARK
ncbi:hypothetical protein FQN57_003334 [Myotisia sp. PD_48]|nr:hypothetical protein FQN57_003334 [Myotisia sp. PD_48]